MTSSILFGTKGSTDETEFEDISVATTSNTPVGNLAFIHKLKALSKQHMSDMEGKSNRTYNTEEETPPEAYEIFSSSLDESKTSSIPSLVSSVMNFDYKKYTSRVSASFSMCNTAVCGSTDDVAESNEILSQERKKMIKLKNKFTVSKNMKEYQSSRPRNYIDRRREKADRMNGFDCADIIVNHSKSSVSTVSGITMNTLQVLDLQQRGKQISLQRTNSSMSRDEAELQEIRGFLISETGRNGIYKNKMSLDSAVKTLHAISKEYGVPVGDLLNDQGLRDFLQRPKA